MLLRLKRKIIEFINDNFHALTHKAFLYYFIGQGFSNMGTWMQNVALSWITLKYTNSPLLLGLTYVMYFFSALLFALFHMNPWQFPAAFALGLILGWIRIRTGSVLACIAGHAIHNGLVFLSVFYYNDLKDLLIMQPGDVKNYGIHFSILAFGIVLLWLFTKGGVKDLIKDSKPGISSMKERVTPVRRY